MSQGRFVWLASYPKSGNTWLRFMLASLLREGKEVNINAINLGVAPASHVDMAYYFGVESSDLLPAEIEAVRPRLYDAIAAAHPEERIFVKTHDHCWRNAAGERAFPPELSHGALYVVRDPRDVAISSMYAFAADIEQVLNMMADPSTILGPMRTRLIEQLPQPLGSWSSHVLSWLDDAGMPVLLLRYEDMLADPVGKLTEAAKFLNLPATHAAAAVEATRLERLQAQESEHGFRERQLRARRFFRSGKPGEGQRVLTAAQLARIEHEHGAVMARLGYL